MKLFDIKNTTPVNITVQFTFQSYYSLCTVKEWSTKKGVLKECENMETWFSMTTQCQQDDWRQYFTLSRKGRGEKKYISTMTSTNKTA